MVAIPRALSDASLLKDLEAAITTDFPKGDCAERSDLTKDCHRRSEGLTEMEITFEPSLHDRLMEHISVLTPMLDAFLERDYKTEFIGAFGRGASKHPQQWHKDCGDLFRDVPTQLPPHCVTVFVPLVDCDESNGCTEFLLGSHLRGDVREQDDLAVGVNVDDGLDQLGPADPNLDELRLRSPVMHLKANVSAGSIIVYDYRTIHRAGVNRSGKQRNIVEVNFCRSWYQDSCN